MPHTCSQNSSRRRNFIAGCVTVFSVAILYSSFDPVPAGEDVSVRRSSVPPIVIDEGTVPLPVSSEALSDSVNSVAASDMPKTSSEASVAVEVPDGGLLSGMETIKFCYLLLKDGETFLENASDYSVVFHKEERINGDLKPLQTINLKVQHKPHIAVYMRWENGERGRQLLYSDQYEDGCMVVKFGGFKKMLPALKIDPNSAIAMAESRYPATQAGVLGMLKQILIHRERDLKRGHGVSCRRLQNQVVDERDCYCFLLKYDSREFSDVYRKSLILVDTRHHIPLMVRNYTWTEGAEELSDEELDKLTLIENYSFTGFDLNRELVAEDFSRDNPVYRM